MSILNIIGGSIMILASIFILVAVTIQESPKGTGISALTGGESYYSKNQGRTRDALLGKVTKICAVLFFVVTIAVSVVNTYLA